MFEKLGFDVVVFSDLKANEIRQNVSRYSFGNDIEDYKGKAFVLIILSHGGAGDVICGTDGGAVELHMLQECFYTESCESLAGVPKVFLIGACRGGTDEKGYSFLTKAGTNQESNETRTYITDSSDFITVFASTRGNRAFGYKEDGEMKGSFFTQILIKVIEEADENTEFNEIIREVRFRVQQAVEQVAIKAGQIPKEQAPGVKTVMTQTVQANSTLMRPYYIKRFVFLD